MNSLLLAMVQAVAAAAATGPPVVTTSLGRVFGTALPPDAHGAAPVNQFLGIPFAEPTKRWEPPIDLAIPYRTDPFNATMWGSACLQVLNSTASYGSMDCLKLNVWQPAGTDNSTLAPKPVLVFIYGGSNQFGEAEPYNMSGIAAFHDVVAVNMNYRTGPIGWAAFPEDVSAGVSTGNFGILDIQSALRWVQREISHFGGDPARVAIHGQSSGAGLVELQYISPLADGLFHAVVSESGGLGAAPLEEALANTRQMASQAGCPQKAGEMKRCMQRLTGLQITNMTYASPWGPTVDRVAIPRDPMSMLRAGHVNHVQAVVFGAQTNDSFLFLSRDFTMHNDVQPNSHSDGDLMYMNASHYQRLATAALGSRATARERALLHEIYPAVEAHDYPAGRPGSIRNTQSLGRIASDKGLCANRRARRALPRPAPVFPRACAATSPCRPVCRRRRSSQGIQS